MAIMTVVAAPALVSAPTAVAAPAAVTAVGQGVGAEREREYRQENRKEFLHVVSPVCYLVRLAFRRRGSAAAARFGRGPGTCAGKRLKYSKIEKCGRKKEMQR
jgi:hypothetical protein